ncbi:uncharacterized protein [Physcomitrium patens]|uniref:Methyltransferase-like protein 5 n=1 Tax=Physcomitrium patens TaxID=3218 RepID=A0A2K1KFF8_PHYPA|nr:methyltransferase-like protein 5 [Physcomitrium patens]PNR52512.1 hypothetical protein PHYPA_008886 [Physcomitrium patens]|eukprot:XP_024377854.1 methyltransferase-like protein 5 [Physcomitrella patens]
MKLKLLESYLGSVTQFPSPKVELEQYPTGPHIASRMLYMAENSFGDITGKVVADLGCGCGTLGIAAALLDAAQVVGVDVDEDALALAQENCEELEVEMDLIQANLSELPLQGLVVDTVVMNPPFGTRRKGADMEFLAAALKVAGTAVYSLHKSSTRTHIKRAAVRDFGAKTADVMCELRYDLQASYKFHKQKEKDIAVDLWRFTTSSV